MGSISKSDSLSRQSDPSSSRSTCSSCRRGMMSAPALTLSIAAWNYTATRLQSIPPTPTLSWRGRRYILKRKLTPMSNAFR